MFVDKSAAAMKKYVSQLQLEEPIPEKFWPLLQLRRYTQGEYLCYAGDRPEFLWIVAEGRCKVIPASEYGKTVVLNYLEPLDLISDIELFNECPFLYSVQAEGPVTAIAIPRDIFFNEMMGHLAFTQLLCQRFANKAYISSKKHSSAMLYSNKERLAHYIIKRLEDNPSQSIDFLTSEVAQYLGITARHLRRVLAELEDEGLIKRDGNQIWVINMKNLECYAIHF